MKCIYCQGKTSVTNSRYQKRSNNTWRRRQCQACKAVFTTTERPELARSWAYEKKDGSLQPFMPEKLLISLYESLRHKKSAQSDAATLTDTIVSGLASNVSSATIYRQQLIDQTAQVLENFDKAAAVHYRAFHS